MTHRIRQALAVAAVLCLLAVTAHVAYAAGQTRNTYTDPAIARLFAHQCKTEDSYMFIPARWVKPGVTLQMQTPPVLCVQIDHPYPALPR